MNLEDFRLGGFKPSRVYIYCDVDRNPIGAEARFEPGTLDPDKKQCPQYRWEAGKFLCRLDGLILPLYRLPELLANADSEIVFVEGPKCAEAVAALGFTATTTPGGTGNLKSWLKARADTLRDLSGRTVYLLPDNDDPGRAHMLTLGLALTAAGGVVKIAPGPLPWDSMGRAADVVNWIEADNGVEDLRELLYTFEDLDVQDSDQATEPADDLPKGDTSDGAGTDLWFARRIAREHGDNLKFVWKWRAWIAWDPGESRWVRDDGAAAWSAAKDSVHRLLAEAVECAGADEARGKALLKSAKRFMGRPALDGSLKLAQSEAAIVATHDEWDRDPYLLNCANGTLDLRTGTLLPHRREDRITKTTGVDFHPDAECPLFKKFLAHVLPDAGVREYVQRAIGYSAIGATHEHLLHVAWGSGANGKSVLFGVVKAALGGYAVSVPPSLLVKRGRFSEHPTQLTVLHGARLALASETAEGGHFDEQQMKSLTGGDTIIARGMRENYWEFEPTHALWVQTNHKPEVRETTLAFWRRMRLVPFDVTISPDKQDAKLGEKLKTELPGVLRWIVNGALAYQLDGLEPPDAINAATDDYEAEEDPLAEFAELIGPGYISSAELYKRYKNWTDESGAKPWRRRTLTGKFMTRPGWVYVKTPARGFRVEGVPKRPFGLGAIETTYVGN